MKLLGALPDAWRSGSFRHFSAPGTLDVSCRWENGRAVQLEISARSAGEWLFSINGQDISIALSEGETKKLQF